MYFDSQEKKECFGCEACIEICRKHAISMEEDLEGFRYPSIDSTKCINCGMCRSVCPFENSIHKYEKNKYVFGGYILNKEVRFESTSGGAFSAIVDAFCDENYIVFGAEAKKLSVFHNYTTDKGEIRKFRKSKYSQSSIGSSYKDARMFLLDGKKVLFSGTPCQIAGLLSFLGNTNKDNLLTVEVVCEGVPSPLFIRKLGDYIEKKYGADIESVDYRYTGESVLSYVKRLLKIDSFNGKWDFEIMKVGFQGNKKALKKDRWFNPFWSIWLNHLMSRPSCYHCKFATLGRVADITLGDLWGVHLYCPELYGNNGGASLVICNTEKGKNVFNKAQTKMYGHELRIEDALKYQSPMRKTIDMNENRDRFMHDLESNMSYEEIIEKWATKPSLKLICNKYIWGNRQKILLWNIKQKISLYRKGA